MMHSRMRSRIAALLTGIGMATVAGAQTIYVNSEATGAGTGATWVDAFTDLQQALAAASGREVWIARGTYYPGPVGSSVSASFVVPSGCTLIGGFAGFESNLSQRDPGENQTVLSGDLGRNDPTAVFDNAQHVVTAVQLSQAPVLDTLTIVGGRASLSFGPPLGGGLLVNNAPIVVRNCAFSGNTTVTGAGGAGGAVGVVSSPSARFENTNFSGNSAGMIAQFPPARETVGGALHASGSTLEIVRCIFIANHGGEGQGSWCDHGTIRPGSPGMPGGAIGLIDSFARVESSIFIANSAGKGGDGIVCYVGMSSRSGPGASGGSGAAIFASGGSLDVASCVFDANLTGAPGYSPAGTTPASAGVNTLSIDGTIARVFACTFVGNKTPAGVNLDLSLASSRSHIVWTPGDPMTPIDPMFVAPLGADGVLGTIDDDFRLRNGSPYIDAGDNTAIPAGFTIDAAGLGRFADMPGTPDTGIGVAPIIDRGAFELHTPICAADFDGSGFLDMADIFEFVNAWFAHSPTADFDGGGLGVLDVFGFLNAWFAGC